MPDRTPTRDFTLTVRYAETDAQGVVHHANYLTWFEEGRSEFLRQQGCFYSDMERDGFFVIVAKATVDRIFKNVSKRFSILVVHQ